MRFLRNVSRFTFNVSRITVDKWEVCNGYAIGIERDAGDASAATRHLAREYDELWPERRCAPLPEA